MDRNDPLLAALAERFDDAVRAVAVRPPGAERYELRYEREDVVCPDALLRELLIQALHTRGQERLFRAGDLRAVIRLFDETLAVNTFDAEAGVGAFVGLDPSAGVDPTDVVELCRRHRPAIKPEKSD